MEQKRPEHPLRLSTHRPGLVYDFVTVCSSMNAIPKQYAPGVRISSRIAFAFLMSES